MQLEAVDFGTAQKGWNRQQKLWPGLKSFIKVTSQRTIGEKKSVETRYYMSSMAGDVQQAATAVRSHWAVESFHWTLDVTFKEDASRVRLGHAAENFALIRRMAVSILKSSSLKKSINRKRNKCSWNNKFLTETLLNAPTF